MTKPTKPHPKNIQDIQDDLFRKMSAEKRLEMASNFFHFAKELNPDYFMHYGTAGFDKKNRRHPQRS